MIQRYGTPGSKGQRAVALLAWVLVSSNEGARLARIEVPVFSIPRQPRRPGMWSVGVVVRPGDPSSVLAVVRMLPIASLVVRPGAPTSVLASSKNAGAPNSVLSPSSKNPYSSVLQPVQPQSI